MLQLLKPEHIFSNEEKGITLERLKTCQKIIYQVVSFISGQLFWESNIGGLPVPQDQTISKTYFSEISCPF